MKNDQTNQPAPVIPWAYAYSLGHRDLMVRRGWCAGSWMVLRGGSEAWAMCGRIID